MGPNRLWLRDHGKAEGRTSGATPHTRGSAVDRSHGRRHRGVFPTRHPARRGTLAVVFLRPAEPRQGLRYPDRRGLDARGRRRRFRDHHRRRGRAGRHRVSPRDPGPHRTGGAGRPHHPSGCGHAGTRPGRVAARRRLRSGQPARAPGRGLYGGHGLWAADDRHAGRRGQGTYRGRRLGGPPETPTPWPGRCAT